MKTFLILLLAAVVFTGCRKQETPKVDFKESTFETEEKKAAVYTAINKIGVIHMDTYFYSDVEMVNGEPIKTGESVTLIGESETGYIVLYGDKKGYIKKDYVMIVENNDDAENAIKNIVVEEHVENIIINETTKAYNTDFTTAVPPTTLYTTNKSDNQKYSGNFLSAINKQRESAKLPTFKNDSSLAKEAAYYCDIFAKGNKTYSINGYGVQAVGKMKGSGSFDKIAKSIVNNISGFNSEKVSKVGVSVIDDDKGYFYYVVLAK